MDIAKRTYIEDNIKLQISQLNKDLQDDSLWEKNEVGCSSVYMKELEEEE